MAFTNKFPFRQFISKAINRPVVASLVNKSILEKYQNQQYRFLMNKTRSSLSSVSLDNRKHFKNAQVFSTAAPQDDRGFLVYQGRQSKLMRRLKIFSISTSVFTFALQPFLLYEAQDMSLAWAVPLFTVINIFTFANPLLIHFISKKYVLEMYFNTETKVFTSITLNWCGQKKPMTFTADDVEVPDVPGMFTMFKAKGNPLFAFEGDFSSIEVYKHMMGFDKPLDLTYHDPPKD